MAFAITLAMVPACAFANKLFALVNTGEIFVSSDSGSNWDPLAVLPVPDAVGIVAGDTSAELTLATESGLIYRSLDSGVNWNVVGSVPSADVVDLQIRSGGSLLVLTATGTLWMSTDSGFSFTALAAFTGSDYVSLAVGRTGDLYALTKSGGIEESTDAGASWVIKGVVTVPDAVEIRALGTDLYVLTGTGLIARSADSGTNWAMVGTLSQVHMAGLTQDVNRLAAITQEGELASSGDGSDWTWVGTVNQLSVTALANDIPYAVAVGEEPAATQLWFAPPRPNPLYRGSRAITLQFELSNPDLIRAVLYDTQGRQVLARAPQWFGTAGMHVIRWDLGNVASGTYFIRIAKDSGFNSAAKLSVFR